jgi:hypothetical protein
MKPEYIQKELPRAAKAAHHLAFVTARLKPCPFKTLPINVRGFTALITPANKNRSLGTPKPQKQKRGMDKAPSIVAFIVVARIFNAPSVDAVVGR